MVLLFAIAGVFASDTHDDDLLSTLSEPAVLPAELAYSEEYM